MLGLPLTTGYAIRAMCALDPTGRTLLLARDLSQRTGVPRPYLSKLLNCLAQSGLIWTKRGHGGGFALARARHTISLLEIAKSIEGIRWRPRCLLGQAECSDERACPAHDFWKVEREKIESVLAGLTLADAATFESRHTWCSATHFPAAGFDDEAASPKKRPRPAKAGPRRMQRRRPGGGCLAFGLVASLLVLPLETRHAAAAPPPSTVPSRPATQIARVRPEARTASCLGAGCHDNVVNQPFVHGPVAQRNCQACHAELEPRQHTFRDAMPRERMCVGCHVLPIRDVVHKPVEVGDCTSCHDPHGSSHKMMLRSDPATTLCVTCHGDLGFQKKSHVHGPVAAGACIVCHDTHSSWHKNLLKKPATELCAVCHDPVREALQSRKHVHRAVIDGKCTDCHDPHASDFRGQLKGDGVTSCLECHEPLRQKLAASPVKHGPITGGDGCAACHVGHASDLPKLQREAQPAACLSCHDRTLKDASGRAITNMAALLKDNPQHHGPIREGNCTACHDPHASQNFGLLATDYPQDFYAPFDESRYRLCFSCHQPELATAKSGAGVTQFRDGDRNLHFVHVNREKGRTCRACHEVHASRRPFHIREATPFGATGWLLEINFEKRDTGGACAPACHKAMSYDRSTPAAPASAATRGARP